MEQHCFRELLKKLQDGSLMPEEENELRAVIGSFATGEESNLFPYEEWEAAGSTAPNKEEIAQSQLAYEGVWRQLQPDGMQSTVVPINRHWWHNRWLQAACLTGLLITAAALYYLSQPLSPATTQPIAWTKISTLQGEKQVIKLPDGSQIYMDGGSTIEYPASFVSNIRPIKLISGEVFLQVQRNEAKPFIVQTGDLQVKVLGTSFSVRNRPEEKEVTVAVKTGKVSFSQGDSSTGKHILLTPGEKGVFERQAGTLAETTCSIAGIGGWITGEFVFDNATLQEILGSLENSYGYHYKVANKALLNKRFKAGFRGHMPQEMVRILSKMGDFHYTIKDSTIIIH